MPTLGIGVWPKVLFWKCKTTLELSPYVFILSIKHLQEAHVAFLPFILQNDDRWWLVQNFPGNFVTLNIYDFLTTVQYWPNVTCTNLLPYSIVSNDRAIQYLSAGWDQSIKNIFQNYKSWSCMEINIIFIWKQADLPQRSTIISHCYIVFCFIFRILQQQNCPENEGKWFSRDLTVSDESVRSVQSNLYTVTSMALFHPRFKMQNLTFQTMIKANSQVKGEQDHLLLFCVFSETKKNLFWKFIKNFGLYWR